VRAARVHELGASPTLDDIPEPEASEGRTAVRVRAVALNPLDLSVGAGRFYGGHPPLPYVAGCEAVVERNDGSRAWFFGDGAGVARDGMLAERALVAEERLVPIEEGALEVQLRLGCERLLARVTRFSSEALGLAVGREVFAVIKTVAIDRRSLSRQSETSEPDDQMETFDS